MEYNLNRYQEVVENVSTIGDFSPKRIIRHMQTHVYNKSYVICRHQQRILENSKWPPDTKFKIEEVN